MAEAERLYSLECPICDTVLRLPDPAMPLPDHMDFRAPMQACTGSGRIGTLLEQDSSVDEPGR